MSAGEDYNSKAETYWYKGSFGYTTQRFFSGFSEVNYTVLRFKSRKSLIEWDNRFARIGVREGWRAGEIFKNEKLLKPNVVSELPPAKGLIALHVDFSVRNFVILTGGNQHKYLTNKPRGLSDNQMKATVQAVAKELKRRALLSEREKQARSIGATVDYDTTSKKAARPAWRISGEADLEPAQGAGDRR